MPINVSWENNTQNAVLFEFDGLWDWKDFHRAENQSNTLMDSVEQPVHLIISLKNSHRLPKNFISKIRSIASNAHPNTGMIIVVGANSFITTMSNVFSKLYHTGERKFAMINTLEEARTLLNEKH